MPKIELKDEERTKCEVFSRVVGFYRPVQDWNPGKKQEFKERKVYNVEKSLKNKLSD